MRVTAFSAFIGDIATGTQSCAGGSELDLWNTARELARSHGAEVRLLTFTVPESCRGVYEDVRLIKVPPPRTHLSRRGMGQRMHMTIFYARLLARLLTVPTDVFYAKLASVETLLVFVAARLRRLPVCFRISHDIETDPKALEEQVFRGNKWLSRMFFRALSNAAAIVCQKPSQVAALRQVGLFTSHVIGNAHLFDPTRPVAKAGERSYILWVGRCHPIKRPLAFVELSRLLPKHHFIMVLAPTNHPDAAMLMTQVQEECARTPNLRLVPGAPRAELNLLYQQARALVLTSEAEGVPNVVIEAFINGVPVVSERLELDGLLSGVSGPVSQLMPSQGFCVVRNPSDMGCLIKRLLSDDDWWTICSHKAVQCAIERFDARRAAEQYHDLFKELVHASGMFR